MPDGLRMAPAPTVPGPLQGRHRTGGGMVCIRGHNRMVDSEKYTWDFSLIKFHIGFKSAYICTAVAICLTMILTVNFSGGADHCWLASFYDEFEKR